MINSPTLVDSNVVLLGDAGYCPIALSGMGASLSIYGAKAFPKFKQLVIFRLILTTVTILLIKFSGRHAKSVIR